MSTIDTVVTAAFTLTAGLSGGFLTATMQNRQQRAARRDAERTDRRKDARVAVAKYAAAIDEHRKAMWLWRDRELTGVDQALVDEAFKDTHRTRGLITEPLAEARILMPEAKAEVERAKRTTYDMHYAKDADELQEKRAASVKAVEALLDKAADVLAVDLT